MSDVITTLKQRGFFSQCTNESELTARIAESLANNTPMTVYLGIDPTSSSLHVGHATPLYMLKHLHDAGLKVITLMGGGTGRIGDPSGKTEARKLLTDDIIEQNIVAIAKQCELFFDYKNHHAFLANNAEWLNTLNYIDFLRDIGKHFSVNRMLSFESYKRRLETGLTFIEFNYQLLQSYDFVMLYCQHNCLVQIGGDDQWGNIVAGIDLLRRLHGVQGYGLTCPLITTASGQKMGKSEKGAVFLDATLTSVFDFYQYWRNTADEDVLRFLKMFTFLPIAECEALAAEGGIALNAAKVRLATEVTTFVHGKQAAEQAATAAMALFTGEGSLENVPQITLPLSDLTAGIDGAELFVRAGLAKSKSEVRNKLILGGGASYNGVKITDVNVKFTPSDLEDGVLLLRAGKKRFCSLIFTNLE